MAEPRKTKEDVPTGGVLRNELRMAGWQLSFKGKNETQFWRTLEESDWVAAMGARLIVTAEVGNAARGDKIARSEAAVAAMVCRPPKREQHHLRFPVGMLVARGRARGAIASSATGLHNTIKTRAEIGEGLRSESSSAPYPFPIIREAAANPHIFLISSAKPISITKPPLTLIIRKEPTHLK